MPARKTRPDAWWIKLKPDQLDAVFTHCESVTLTEGVKWLRATWKIVINPSSLGPWLRKEREDRINELVVDRLRDDRDRALLIGRVFGSATQLTDANSTLLAQVIFEEFRKPEKERDDKRLTAFMDLALKAKREENRTTALKVVEKKFRFNAAKAALKKAAELQAVNQGSGDERSKIDQAISILFGPEPSRFESPAREEAA